LQQVGRFLGYTGHPTRAASTAARDPKATWVGPTEAAAYVWDAGKPPRPFRALACRSSKCWMGATHFPMRRLGKVSTEMALNVFAYNMKLVIAIVGVGVLLKAMTI
jgi:hypothetical protein